MENLFDHKSFTDALLEAGKLAETNSIPKTESPSVK
jgi:hypothetical protein